MGGTKLIGKKRKLGKKIEGIRIGDTYTAEHIILDKELLLYLGLTDDANPLYIQHDYASQTPYNEPIVPRSEERRVGKKGRKKRARQRNSKQRQNRQCSEQ